MLWARMLAYITGTVDQELLERNEYLAAENLCLAKIVSAFEINNIQGGRITCSMYEIQPSRSFGASGAVFSRFLRAQSTAAVEG